MIRAPFRNEMAANDFALCAGLLSAMVIDRSPLEEVAAHYGFSPRQLREKLEAHVAACASAIEPPRPVPQTVIVTPEPIRAEPAIRIRQRRLGVA